MTAGAGVGVKYATGTTAHDTVTAVKASASEVTLTAKSTGTAGNSIATTETMTNGSFGGHATLFGGAALVPGQIETANTIKIGNNAEACIDNLVAAITGGEGEGTTYGDGTVEHATVTAAKTTSATMTATAKTKGTAGNAIDIAENDTNTSWASAAVKLSGGVNGTVGVDKDILIDTSYLYIAVDDNTITDTNWRRISLGSAY
jgi:phage tail sheath gpL-like